MSIKDIADELQDCNPYPITMFPELSENELARIAFAIMDIGYSPDRVFGYWGRQVWHNCAEKMREYSAEKEYQP